MKPILALLISLLLPLQSLAALGYKDDGSLDREFINQLYFEGEFLSVERILSDYVKNKPDMADEEKVFVYKYLSVVYAADPETREKGLSYMYKLIELAPTITLLDLYISDSIQAIFAKAKENYKKRIKEPSEGADATASVSEPDTAAGSAANTGRFDKQDPEAQATQGAPKETQLAASPKPLQESQAAGNDADAGGDNKKILYWTAGGAVVATAVATFIILSSGEEESAPRTVTIKP